MGRALQSSLEAVHGGFEHGDRLLRVRDVCATVGLSRAFVFRLVAARKFPQPVKLAAKATRWSAREVQGWLSEQLAGRAS